MMDFGQFLQVIVRFGTEQIAEYSADTVDISGLLVGQKWCVGKCRDFRIADDGIYFCILAADAFADGGYIISGLDFVEQGRCRAAWSMFSKKDFETI